VSEGLDNVVVHGETRPLQTNRYVLRTLVQVSFAGRGRELLTLGEPMAKIQH